MYSLDASIQSFRRANGYLLTQMPLPDTAVDFWRLVYDHKCPTIIMLLEANSQVTLFDVIALPCLALPCLALPCRAVPCRAVPCRAVPCRAVPCRAVPCLALPCLALATPVDPASLMTHKN